jgi:hypothetical protein
LMAWGSLHARLSGTAEEIDWTNEAVPQRLKPHCK